MSAGRRALIVATYEYADTGLRRLAAPAHDAEALATVLADPQIADFDVTTLLNQPHHVVGEAVADFYGQARRDDLTLLYFTGHGLKDDEGRLHLAMTNTRRSALMFTALSAALLNEAMEASPSRRKVLVLDCCYSGAFPAGRTAKADEGVQTLERFQGKGRAVLTASDATQYAFEGDDVRGAGTSSVFTRYLVEAIRTGAADLDEDGDIALDELYSYVRDRVVAEMPQQRPKKQEDVDGRILIARNVHWTLPAYLRNALDSPIAAQRLSAVPELEHLHRVGNDIVRAAVTGHLDTLAQDDSRSVAAAASEALTRLPADAPARAQVTTTPASATGTPAVAPEDRPAVGPPGPAAEAPPARRAAEPGRSAIPSVPAGSPLPGLPLLLTLVLIGGVLSLLSRFLVFESTYTVVAADFGDGIHWISWSIGVGLPLLVAFQLLAARGTSPWAVALAGGLVAGAGLAQLDLVVASGAYFRTPETSELPGPGWWVTLLAAVVLLACAIAVLRQPAVRVRPGLRRDWRAFSGVLLVVGGLLVWLAALAEASPWLRVNEPALLLAAVCLPVAALDLTPVQRVFGLAAVTVLAAWVASGHVQALIIDSFPVDARASVIAVASVVAAVAGCYVAQLVVHRGSAPPAEAGRAERA